MREASARRWLLALGIPCWFSSLPPGRPGRYGLVTGDGRRIAVGCWPASGWCFDGMAQAKCDFLLGIDPDGEPAGWMTWWDARCLSDPEEELRFDHTGWRDPDDLPGMLVRPRHAGAAWLAGSLKLLLLGELPVPPPGNYSGMDLPAAP